MHFVIPITSELLIRTHHTFPQMEINDKKQRIKNVAGAFEINCRVKNLIKNKSVLIIDDVCTTASTFENCASALQPLKPKNIWGLAVARG